MDLAELGVLMQKVAAQVADGTLPIPESRKGREADVLKAMKAVASFDQETMTQFMSRGIRLLAAPAAVVGTTAEALYIQERLKYLHREYASYFTGVACTANS